MTAISTRVPRPPSTTGHSRASLTVGEVRERAYAVARTVRDPELPMLTLEDLGVLRGVEVDDDGRVVVAITPTYSGCPAMAAMRDDLVRVLRDEGLEARVRVELSPPWSSDWITERGRAALEAAGISPPSPGAAPTRHTGPVPLSLGPTKRAVRCPRCGSAATELTSEFGSTSCKALYRCTDCQEPFEHIKEI